MDRFSEGKNDEPPVEIVVDPVILERNSALSQDVFELVESLPTYVVPGKIYRTQVSRLHSLATLLSGDHIVEGAIAQAQAQMIAVLHAQRDRLESDGAFQRDLDRVRHLRIERSYALLAAETLDDLPDDASYEVERDDNNIEDLFRVAKRRLPEGLAANYWNAVITARGTATTTPSKRRR